MALHMTSLVSELERSLAPKIAIYRMVHTDAFAIDCRWGDFACRFETPMAHLITHRVPEAMINDLRDEILAAFGKAFQHHASKRPARLRPSGDPCVYFKSTVRDQNGACAACGAMQ